MTYKDWISDKGLTKVEAWARDGLTNEQIAKNIGIHIATLYDWQKTYPDFHDALKRGKEIVDIEVENALLMRAMGYEYDEEKTIEEDGVITRHEKTRKSQPPDVTAQIFWLKNRKPEKWRDKRDVEHSGSITETIRNMTEEELEKEAKLYEQATDGRE